MTKTTGEVDLAGADRKRRIMTIIPIGDPAAISRPLRTENKIEGTVLGPDAGI